MPQDPPRPRRRLGRRALVSLASLVLLLAAAELACRLFVPETGAGTRGGFVVPDPELRWRLKPVADGPLATNELGLRDDPYKASADEKVIVVGDSVTWGDGIPDRDACYPQVLERELQAKDPAHTFEVVDAGVPGWATFQEARWLELEGLALQPDLVVLQFCLNDVTARYQVLADYGGDERFLGIDTRAAAPGVHGFLLRWSRAYELLARALQRRARAREAYDVAELTKKPWSPALEDAWKRTLGELEGVRRLCAEHHVPLLLLIVPYRLQLQDPSASREPQDRLLAWCTEHAVPALDLLPRFARASARQPLFRDPSHFSEAGHAHAARLLLAPVRHALGLTADEGEAPPDGG